MHVRPRSRSGHARSTSTTLLGIGWDIFVRSYWKDIGWLELCLRSIARHAHGFGETVLVVPRKSEPWLRRIAPLPPATRLELCDDYEDDYLGQQVTKLHADLYTDAEVICHVDADCILVGPLGPEDLAPSGVPEVVTRDARQLGRHWPWGRVTEAFLGWPVTLDYMQRPPFVYPRALYAEVRRHSVERHGTSLREYVVGCPPRGFSEFNVLGAYADAHHPDWFAWRDADTGAFDARRWRCRWYSSWGGVERARAEIERLIASGQEPSRGPL